MHYLTYPHILALSLLLPACGPADEDTDDAGSTDGEGTAGEPQPTTSGDPAQPTGDPEPGACGSVQGDHTAATCIGGACPIAVDVEVRCNDDHFGLPGLRVGAAPDTTWLVTSSDNDSMLFRVDAAGAERIPGVVEAYPRSTIQLAVDPDGAPHLTVDGSTFIKAGDYAGGLVHIWRDGDVWTETTVFDPPASPAPSTELAIDAMGRPHVFFLGEPPNVYSVAVRDGGTWTTHELPTPGAGAYNRFSLTAAGQEVAYALPFNRVIARSGGEEVKVGPTLNTTVYRAADPAPVGPDLVASLERGDGLTVAWASLGGGSNAGSVDIAGSALSDLTCMEPGPGPKTMECPPPCHETAVGTDPGSHAFTRTANGVGWIAWVVTRRDIKYSYALTEFDDVSFYCKQHVDSDASTGELHLARVPLDGTAPQKALVMPLAILRTSHTSSTGIVAYNIDLRSVGAELALAMRLGEGTTSSFVRVLRLDTAAF